MRIHLLVLAVGIVACERESAPIADVPATPPAPSPTAPTTPTTPTSVPIPVPAAAKGEQPLVLEDMHWADELQRELTVQNRESLSACPRIKDYKACNGASRKTIERYGDHIVVVEETVTSPENEYQPAETSTTSAIYSKKPVLQRLSELAGDAWFSNEKVVAAKRGFSCSALEPKAAITAVMLKTNRVHTVDAPTGATAIKVMGHDPLQIEVNSPSTAIACDATMTPIVAHTYALKCGPKQCTLAPAKKKVADVEACVPKVSCSANTPKVETSFTALQLPELMTRETLDAFVTRVNNESLAACPGVTEPRKCSGAWRWTIQENATHLLLRGAFTAVADTVVDSHNVLFRKRETITSVAEHAGTIAELDDDWLMIIDGPEWVCGGQLKSVALFDQRANRVVLDKSDFEGVRYAIDQTTITVAYEIPSDPVEGCSDPIKSFSRTFQVACTRTGTDPTCTIDKTAETPAVAGCQEPCD